MKTDSPLYLVSGNKSRIGNLEWSDDDYDVREGMPDGPVIGRIYKLSVGPTGNWWFWAVQLFPAITADSGTAETRDAAMAEFKARWEQRRGGGFPAGVPRRGGLSYVDFTSIAKRAA